MGRVSAGLAAVLMTYVMVSLTLQSNAGNSAFM
jgi:hypothetical protein